jgi:hypothetical protein
MFTATLRPSLALAAVLVLASVSSAGVSHSRSGDDRGRSARNTGSPFSFQTTSRNIADRSDSRDRSRDVCSNPGNFCPPKTTNWCDWRGDDDRENCDRTIRRCTTRSDSFNCPPSSVCPPKRDCDRDNDRDCPRTGDKDCTPKGTPPCVVPAPSGSLALACAALAVGRRRRVR